MIIFSDSAGSGNLTSPLCVPLRGTPSSGLPSGSRHSHPLSSPGISPIRHVNLNGSYSDLSIGPKSKSLYIPFASFYRPQKEFCDKIMFLHASVILSTGGTPATHAPPPPHISPCHTCPSPPTMHAPAMHNPPPCDAHPMPCTSSLLPCIPPPATHATIWSTSGRHVSYWNASLFIESVQHQLIDHLFNTSKT